MSNLSQTLSALAQAFATDVLFLARSASVEDIISETNGAPVRRGPGRPPKSPVVVSTLPSTIPPKRMGPSMIDSVASLITRYVNSHQGARAEAIRKELGIPKNKWAVPIALALERRASPKRERSGRPRTG
jgi:hypothetical protein